MPLPRMAAYAAVLAAALHGVSCGAPPSVPTPPAPAAAPGTMSWSGIVTAQHNSQPVAGAVIEAAQAAAVLATTNADGAFQFANLPSGLNLFSITAPGYLTSRSKINLDGPRANFAVKLIPAAAPFDLAFYRDFGRGASDGAMIETRRWTMNPSFYLRTVTDDTGEPIPEATLDGIERVFRASVPELTAGQFQVATVLRGSESRGTEIGWVRVLFYSGLIDNGNNLGDSFVGGNSGRIRLRYGPSVDEAFISTSQNCESGAVAVSVHEIVHAMGYWHTDRTTEDFLTGPGCPGTGRSARARYHASVLYLREPGNTDQDNDRTSFVHNILRQPQAFHAPLRSVACGHEHFFSSR